MKLNKWTLALAATSAAGLASAVQAEESHPVNTLLSSTALSGFVDTAAIWNFGTGQSVANRFVNTGSDRQDGFNLNVVKLQLEKPLDEGTWSAGYKIETMLGPDAIAMPGRLGAAGDIAFKQAYVALRAPVGNGLDFKIGQFDPIVGYEVTDSYANPNFSRSLAFRNLEPLGHQGVLATYQFTDMFGASLGVANTSGTGFGGGFVPPSARTMPGINQKYGRESVKSYMAGVVVKAPESTGWLSGSSLYAGVVKGWAQGKNNDPVDFYVGGSLSTPWKALSIGAAYDYLANGTAKSSYGNAVALYASLQVKEHLKLNGRVEYATSSGGLFLPMAQERGIPEVHFAAVNDERVFGYTFTVDYSLWANVVTRAEFRWDTVVGGSNLRPFDGQKNDLSLALNVIYKF